MAFLLDTNIVSETIGAKPERPVLAWLERQRPNELYLASQTIGELVRGAQKVTDESRRERLTKWIEEDLSRQLESRILAFDDAAARIWGQLMGEGDRKGRPPAAADTQIAAIAIDRKLVLVTRNVRDFERFDLDVLNPWEQRAKG